MEPIPDVWRKRRPYVWTRFYLSSEKTFFPLTSPLFCVYEHRISCPVASRWFQWWSPGGASRSPSRRSRSAPLTALPLWQESHWSSSLQTPARFNKISCLVLRPLTPISTSRLPYGKVVLGRENSHVILSLIPWKMPFISHCIRKAVQEQLYNKFCWLLQLFSIGVHFSLDMRCLIIFQDTDIYFIPKNDIKLKHGTIGKRRK